ncbi:hypothetical protein BLNAU_1780 [Blattamonas nauphoetae]|uniref:Uncharacterized protein n=1 Tax=Blattamonas nauphoetae TaxID=2049346 RepID=A0ABQ9YHL3_9EUKA|nr:hypothetical protein BLNAU_1780 [Blattamonas nauphoetae]
MTDSTSALVHGGFQLYCCGAIDSQFLFYSGGSGAQKTGFGNGVGILKIEDNGTLKLIDTHRDAFEIAIESCLFQGFVWSTRANGAACYQILEKDKSLKPIFSFALEGVSEMCSISVSEQYIALGDYNGNIYLFSTPKITKTSTKSEASPPNGGSSKKRKQKAESPTSSTSDLVYAVNEPPTFLFSFSKPIPESDQFTCDEHEIKHRHFVIKQQKSQTSPPLHAEQVKSISLCSMLHRNGSSFKKVPVLVSASPDSLSVMNLSSRTMIYSSKASDKMEFRKVFRYVGLDTLVPFRNAKPFIQSLQDLPVDQKKVFEWIVVFQNGEMDSRGLLTLLPLVDLSNESKRFTLTKFKGKPDDRWRGIALNFDSSLFAVGSAVGRMHVGDLSSGAILDTQKTLGRFVSDIEFVPLPPSKERTRRQLQKARQQIVVTSFPGAELHSFQRKTNLALILFLLLFIVAIFALFHENIQGMDYLVGKMPETLSQLDQTTN